VGEKSQEMVKADIRSLTYSKHGPGFIIPNLPFPVDNATKEQNIDIPDSRDISYAKAPLSA
jgi:hypothetical protein